MVGSLIQSQKMEGPKQSSQNLIVLTLSELYKQHKGEKALTLKLTQHQLIMQLPIMKNETIDRSLLLKRHCYSVMHSTSLRCDNVHKLNEKDIIFKEGNRPRVIFTTSSTKTSNEEQNHYLLCECPPSQAHSPFNLSCGITLFMKYNNLKEVDFQGLKMKSKQRKSKDELVFKDLPYFRRVRYVSKKQTDTYYDKMRWGLKNIQSVVKDLAKEARIAPPKKSNIRRTDFTGTFYPNCSTTWIEC